MDHGLSQQGIWVPFWTPKPLKRTPQDYHTVKIIRYGTGTVYFIRFRYANGIDTGYFHYFVDVFEILSRALVLGKVWWGWTSTM